MLTRRLAVNVCVLAALVMLLVEPASARSDAPASEIGPLAPVCDLTSSRFCYWTQAGFTGTKLTLFDRPNGTCVWFPSGARSFANQGSVIEGYFYETRDCGGRARAVRAHSEVSDLGFQAHGFRHACVSC